MNLNKKNYPYFAAGKTWIVPLLTLEKLSDGTVVLTEEEITRIHHAIANQICGNKGNLSIEEFEFLADITDASYSEIAEHLGLHRSTLSKWRKAGSVPNIVLSQALKRWFWFKVFGDRLAGRKVSIGQAVDEAGFLNYVKEQAIEKQLTESIEQMIV